MDEVRLEVRAQEIHAIIIYTVTDLEAYNALNDGLWFEFMPSSSASRKPLAATTCTTPIPCAPMMHGRKTGMKPAPLP